MGYMKQVSLQVEACQTTAGLINGALTEVEDSLGKALMALQEANALLPGMIHVQGELDRLGLDVPLELEAAVTNLRQQLQRIEHRLVALDGLITPFRAEPQFDERTGSRTTDGEAVELVELDDPAERESKAIAVASTSQLALRYLIGAVPFLLMLAGLGLSVSLVVLCPHWFYR